MTKRQIDDNIDDLGRRPDGSKQEQPGTEEVERIKEDTVEAERDEDEVGDANPSPMNPAFP
ncbi:hypothetical protein LJR016_005215 [Devosia sp. LjRoot16]|jgi:hypothetical protein|uniref:hypothetical protein n=1 Tax=Devosia sp. LjRoot16 TaxID=3342271 RepID=UPI003ED0AD9F